ncbi:MAG: ORF6N domain-containing protein [Opitutaceae bacterium]
MKARNSTLVPQEIEERILTLRGLKVLLDEALAVLYGVPTKVLLQAVKRNKKRFPIDFMFQIDRQELANLRSQFVTSSYGGRRYLPYAFTQEGVAMLSSVLRSPRAVSVNVEIMRAFVRLRRLALSVDELARKVEVLEKNYDERFRIVFAAIRELMTPPAPPPRRRIGFVRTD